MTVKKLNLTVFLAGVLTGLFFLPRISFAGCCVCSGQEKPYFTETEADCYGGSEILKEICKFDDKDCPDLPLATAATAENQYYLPGFSGGDIGQYIFAIYNISIGLAAILAVIMIMAGGVLWLLAGGSPERVNNAKSYIFTSLIGLILVLSSYLLLQTLNPRLIELKMPAIDILTKIETTTDIKVVSSLECTSICGAGGIKEYNKDTGSCVCNEAVGCCVFLEKSGNLSCIKDQKESDCTKDKMKTEKDPIFYINDINCTKAKYYVQTCTIYD